MSKFKWTRKSIGVMVLISFLSVFLIVSFLPESYYISIPKLTVTKAGTVYSHLYEGTPPLSYRFEVECTTNGILSVSNPVHVKVTLREVNITNFLDYFCGVTFTGAYPFPTEESRGYPMNSVIVYVNQNGDGTYSGESDVVWLEEGPSYISEVINNPVGHHVPISMYENSTIVLTVSSASDTLTMHFTANTARLTWQIGSFSIIILQPVFEAILLKERKSV